MKEIGLYPKLLGNSWCRLDQAVQRLHEPTALIHAAGVFRVHGGSCGLARLLARLARLPWAGEAVGVQLLVTARGDSEEWRRTFAGRPLVSWQSGRADGLLVEYMGLVEMRFRLQVVEGVLTYQTTGTALCVGPLRLRFPRWLGPRVTASENSTDDGTAVDVAVEVNLPWLGRLLAYEGRLSRVEAQA